MNKARRLSDAGFRLQENIRTRINTTIRDAGCSKHGSAMEMLGCSVPDFIKHIEGLFAPGMTWGNRGDFVVGGPDMWHLDHIRPCASFDLSDPKQQKACFHYTNMQPMWAKDNLRKGSLFNGIRFITKTLDRPE